MGDRTRNFGNGINCFITLILIFGVHQCSSIDEHQATIPWINLRHTTGQVFDVYVGLPEFEDGTFHSEKFNKNTELYVALKHVNITKECNIEQNYIRCNDIHLTSDITDPNRPFPYCGYIVNLVKETIDGKSVTVDIIGLTDIINARHKPVDDTLKNVDIFEKIEDGKAYLNVIFDIPRGLVFTDQTYSVNVQLTDNVNNLDVVNCEYKTYLNCKFLQKEEFNYNNIHLKITADVGYVYREIQLPNPKA